MSSNRLLLKNINVLYSVYDQSPGLLRGSAMQNCPQIRNAWLACEEGRISAYGEMADFPGISDWKGLEVIDCSGKLVLPGYVDSHTHLVYAGNREQEFSDRIKGLSYEDIAARGGGILNSADKLRASSEDDLFEQSKTRLQEIISQGTVAVEIKSGYGLDLESELKILRVIRRLKELDWIPVKATFLGAHAVPKEFKANKSGYIDLIIHDMLPAIKRDALADYIDVFCERNYFSSEETRVIFEAGLKHGLRPRLHAEQLSHSNGIKTAVSCGAASVDHLEFCNEEDMDLLLNSDTIPTILPGAAFFLNLPLPPARRMIDKGLALALASDYNPGSCPSGNMSLMMSLACVQYRLTPEEAFNAASINSAYSLGLENELGSITPGKRANLLISKAIPSLGFIPYAFGGQHIEKVILNARVWA
ncbi:MAG TPA: imidazolonepropionase [Bacteroidia bacterium]|nr:imidazolonepropionase [Bacteroidia bacterium]